MENAEPDRYWNLDQAILWLLTRDGHAVRMASSDLRTGLVITTAEEAMWNEGATYGPWRKPTLPSEGQTIFDASDQLAKCIQNKRIATWLNGEQLSELWWEGKFIQHSSGINRLPKGAHAWSRRDGNFVLGVLVKSDDVITCFPDPMQPVTEGKPETVRKKRGAVSYEEIDGPLIEKMHQLINDKVAHSVHAAAGMVVGQAKGMSVEVSKLARLRKRYAKRYSTK